jgi:spermidine/putrescine transport system permease protein
VNAWARRLLLAAPVLWVAALHAGPLLLLARISVFDAYPGPPGRVPASSLAAWAAFRHGPGTVASLGRSLGLAAATTGLALLLAFPLAYHVALRVPPARRGRRLLLLVAPFWAGEVVRTFALALLLARNGALNAALRWAGLAPVQWLYGPGAVLAGMVYAVLLSMLLPLYAALDRLPRELLDAATDLGAGPWRRLWRVTLPLSAPGVAVGCALCFLVSLGVLAAPALLGGAGGPVFAAVVADAFGSGRWPDGAAFGLILLLAGMAGAATLAWPMRQRNPT